MSEPGLDRDSPWYVDLAVEDATVEQAKRSACAMADVFAHWLEVLEMQAQASGLWDVASAGDSILREM